MPTIHLFLAGKNRLILGHNAVQGCRCCINFSFFRMNPNLNLNDITHIDLKMIQEKLLKNLNVRSKNFNLVFPSRIVCSFIAYRHISFNEEEPMTMLYNSKSLNGLGDIAVISKGSGENYNSN